MEISPFSDLPAEATGLLLLNGGIHYSHRSNMNTFNRRQFLKDILGKLAQAAGTVVVASAASIARAQEPQSEGAETPQESVQERADRLAASCDVPAEESDTAVEFLNGGFRNTPFGAFRNAPVGGFRNTPLGNFRNSPFGGFRNTPFGAFSNGGWPNGGWGGFRNGGWPNMGWRNGW